MNERKKPYEVKAYEIHIDLNTFNTADVDEVMLEAIKNKSKFDFEYERNGCMTSILGHQIPANKTFTFLAQFECLESFVGSWWYREDAANEFASFPRVKVGTHNITMDGIEFLIDVSRTLPDDVAGEDEKIKTSIKFYRMRRAHWIKRLFLGKWIEIGEPMRSDKSPTSVSWNQIREHLTKANDDWTMYQSSKSVRVML